MQRGLPEFERQHACVDAGKLEQIVDERGECLHLLADCGQVLRRVGESVFECLEHRPQRRERRPQIVACRGDQLPPGVEELFDVGSHLVE